MKRKLLWLLQWSFLLFPKKVSAQSDNTCGLQISVLTCSPGNELYSLFGHTALRINDSSNRTDIIYNWGTFDFDEPNFYTKFLRGNLLYYVSPGKLPVFLYEYQYEQRTVIEQILNLTCDEKKQIKQAVEVNMTGNNRFYKYDFLTDNCTTRIRDIIYNNVKKLKVAGDIVEPGTTFRNMLYHYLDNGGQPWSKLGIDVLLGAKIDHPATNKQAMFLPEYFMKALDSSVTINKSIVEQEKQLVSQQNEVSNSNKYTPLIVISIISVVIFCLSFLKKAWANTMMKFVDSFLLYITGVIGLLIVFMWFFTDHAACSDNFNLLWAIPANIVVGFLIWKKPVWTKMYFIILSVITALPLLCWFWLPQQLNLALIPFMLLLIYRYIMLGRDKRITTYA